MSEADRLWREAMEAAAKRAEAEGRTALKYPDEAIGETYCYDAAAAIRGLPRPAGWGEGGKDE